MGVGEAKSPFLQRFWAEKRVTVYLDALSLREMQRQAGWLKCQRWRLKPMDVSLVTRDRL